MSLQVNIKKKLHEFTMHIEFETDKGCLGILGASGCGKSMTLKAIAGIMTPDEGSIVLDGKVLYDSKRKINIRPRDRNIGYLFQNYALFPNMTVEENIRAGTWNTGLTKRQQREKAKQMMERFHLDGLAKQYPGQLSGGQQQRVALARILVYEPSILLLDEPFSAMDPHLKEGLQMELARELRHFGGIAVMVTHDRDEVYKLSDQLMIMDQGEILAKDETKRLFWNPRSVQAARLTGCKNILKVVKTGRYEVKVPDWGIEFKTAEPVSEKVTAIGIRAHDLYAVEENIAAGNQKNVFWVEPRDIIETPFEWNVIFDTTPESKEKKPSQIFWKIPKEGYGLETSFIPPKYLGVDKEKILLLEE